MDEAVVGLADAIEALRSELTKAMTSGEDEPMRFSLDPVELTVQAVITKDTNGEIGWKVLKVGGSYESQRTQTLVLKLSPLWTASDGRLTSDFTVASVGRRGDTVGPHN